jgi:hypothetical protein
MSSEFYTLIASLIGFLFSLIIELWLNTPILAFGVAADCKDWLVVVRFILILFSKRFFYICVFLSLGPSGDLLALSVGLYAFKVVFFATK